MNPNQNDPNNPTPQPDLGSALGGSAISDTPPNPTSSTFEPPGGTSTITPQPSADLGGSPTFSPSSQPSEPAVMQSESTSPLPEPTMDSTQPPTPQPDPALAGNTSPFPQEPVPTQSSGFDPSQLAPNPAETLTPNPYTQPPQESLNTGGFSWSPTPPSTDVSQNPNFPPQSQEPAPTDLSQLAANGSQSVYTPPVTQPETLVVPPSDQVESPLQNGGGGGIPKWVIGIGVGLLLAVVGASGYFILGIGQAPQQSIPATEEQTLTQPPQLQRSPSPASPSAGFGALQQEQATSAADLIRQRQEQEEQ